ncbi:uncharacterized protein LOC128671601 [Plodia interpunctella]|uniref:uncharacterized protein LOC128671601 n=1 Tax=Plodia interpunctella TaxID=58824 RepID=UPI0023687BA3|nr:uncharacterized protein LOC128671601 [Plodia interpunctella]
MAEKRKRGQNFSLEEKDKLVKLLLLHKDTILNKKTDGATNEAKCEAWTAVTNSFNSSSNIYRSKESLMKVWDKLKSESKLYFGQLKRNTTQTGGGPSIIKFDPVLEQVCSILGRGCTGIIGVSDCDADTGPEVFETPKVICIQDDSNIWKTIEDVDLEIKMDNCQNSTDTPKEILTEESEAPKDFHESQLKKTPLWSRRRPHISNYNERTEASTSVSSSIRDVYKKKENIEDLKEKLFREELDFKKKLYSLQLQAAAKDLEIKNAMLEQIQGGGFSLNNLYGGQKKN